ncbi:MAG: isoamylase early set domain-containing protein [Anaerolinea sp.]|nr:isoamylase early set domain-containing protein [Anaerolinea sp.]
MLTKKFFKTKEECEVTFAFQSETANDVQLVGDFNDWQPMSMKKGKGDDGAFKVKVRLPKDGQFQFRYLVDNQIWANDETADAYWTNEHGSDNSVVFTAGA